MQVRWSERSENVINVAHRIHKDAKEHLQMEFNALKELYHNSQAANKADTVTFHSTINNLNLEIADLRSQVKIKTYENTSLSMALDAKTQGFNMQQLEREELLVENKSLK